MSKRPCGGNERMGRNYACHQIIDLTSKNVRPKHKIKESRFDADINTLSCGNAGTWVTEWTHLKKGGKKTNQSEAKTNVPSDLFC